MAERTGHIALISLSQFDPYLRDGASLCNLEWLRFLRDQGNKVSIVSFLASNCCHKRFDDALADAGAAGVVREGNTCRATFRGLDYSQCILPFRLDELSRKGDLVLKTITKGLQQRGFDYVLTSGDVCSPLVAAWLLQIPGAHLFNSSVNVDALAGSPSYVRFLHGRLVLVLSQFLRDRVSESLDLDAVVSYPFVRLDDYRVGRDRSRTGTIGFCSTQGAIKGNEIFAGIVQRLPQHSFIAVGGRYRIRPDACPPNLACWGHIPDMERFYRQIDLLLVPSLCEEAFSRVILEAAANGIPVIANRVGGIPEALGESGVLIDWDRGREPNIAELAEKYVTEIRRILGDDALYHHHRRQALARAQEYEAQQAEMAHHICDRYILPVISRRAAVHVP